MAANDRNHPIRQRSSWSDYSLMEFMREFPDDAACLDTLWREKYAPDGHHAHCPRCEKQRKFHRTKTRVSYTCDTCGLHVHPMKGTIFEKSTTSLQLWFYAMYLMASTRCGISAKQLEREIGVGYKTAHRMMKLIRTQLMEDDDEEPLAGEVEVDETLWGGRPRGLQKMTRQEAARFRESKATVLGMVERNGRVRARVVPSRRGPAFSREVVASINPLSVIYTDDWIAYKPLSGHFAGHRVINHSAGQYVDDEGTNTNTIEGFFGNLKTGMRGAYKHVSPRYLQSYLNEYSFRHNAQRQHGSVFQHLLDRATQTENY
jgi:transposase